MDKKSKKVVKKAPAKKVLTKKSVAAKPKPVTKKMPEKKALKAKAPVSKLPLLAVKAKIVKTPAPVAKPAVKKVLVRKNTAASQQYDKVGAKFYMRSGRQSLRSWLRERFKWPQEKLIAAAREAGYYPGLTVTQLSEKLEEYRYHVEWEMAHGKIKTSSTPAVEKKSETPASKPDKKLLKKSKESGSSSSRSAADPVAQQKGKQPTAPKAKAVPAVKKATKTPSVAPATAPEVKPQEVPSAATDEF